MNKEVVEIFTDGACRGNPGPGGWGVVMRYGKHHKHLHGGELATTNNRMELTAAIKSLEALKHSCVVIITTDSQYVRKGITEWLVNWQKNNWRTSNKKPVKNKDLWRRLSELNKNFQIEWRWVKGHSGHAENEMADELANKGIDELLS